MKHLQAHWKIALLAVALGSPTACTVEMDDQQTAKPATEAMEKGGCWADCADGSRVEVLCPLSRDCEYDDQICNEDVEVQEGFAECRSPSDERRCGRCPCDPRPCGDGECGIVPDGCPGTGTIDCGPCPPPCLCPSPTITVSTCNSTNGFVFAHVSGVVGGDQVQWTATGNVRLQNGQQSENVVAYVTNSNDFRLEATVTRSCGRARTAWWESNASTDCQYVGSGSYSCVGGGGVGGGEVPID